MEEIMKYYDSKSFKSSMELMGYSLVNSANEKKVGRCHDFLFDDGI